MNSENLSEEIQESGRLLLADGPWDPLGDEPRPLEYTMRKKGERTYAKNAAVDTTFQVKVNDRYRGQRLRDIRRGLHGMFEDILQEARWEMAGNDLGRVVIHHDGLHDPIVVPLRPWDRLNVDVMMEHIEKVLNSHQELSVNDSFDITIGTIDLPKGGGKGNRRPITSLQGDKNSIQIKTSLVTIDNNDQLCMARAIGVGWAKLNLCTKEEWNDLTHHHHPPPPPTTTTHHQPPPPPTTTTHHHHHHHPFPPHSGPLFPDCTFTVSSLYPTVPQLNPHCAPMYPHCTPLCSHCIPTVSSLYPHCIPTEPSLYLHCAPIYPHCILTVPHCTLTVPPLYPPCTLNVSSFPPPPHPLLLPPNPTVPQLNPHCAPMYPHCTLTVSSFFPPPHPLLLPPSSIVNLNYSQTSIIRSARDRMNPFE